MKEISTDSNQNMLLFLEIIENHNLTGEEVFNLFIDWNGNQICTKEFMENITECEGYTL